jgi:hypothetical protein
MPVTVLAGEESAATRPRFYPTVTVLANRCSMLCNCEDCAIARSGDDDGSDTRLPAPPPNPQEGGVLDRSPYQTDDTRAAGETTGAQDSNQGSGGQALGVEEEHESGTEEEVEEQEGISVAIRSRLLLGIFQGASVGLQSAACPVTGAAAERGKKRWRPGRPNPSSRDCSRLPLS